MKLLVIARPFVFHGGVERATAGLVSALVAHGYEIDLLTFGTPLPVAGVTVHRLAVPTSLPTVRALWLAAAARRFVARGAWDLVQSHERTLSQDLYRAGEGCHRAYLASRANRRGRGLYHRVVLALERRVFTGTPRLVAIAQRGKREIETVYGVDPARVSVVYNGVDLERFHPRLRTTVGPRARAELGLGAADWVLLFVGSGFARKGLDTALRAFATLKDRASRLLVVGKAEAGPYRQLADRLGVDSRIVWLGPRSDVERWYGAADTCVLPARYEPFGNVHLEALASGVPIVTSVAAGGSEVLVDGVNGAAVEPDAPDALAAALGRFRPRSVSHREELSVVARAAAEPFTYDAQVAGFEQIYRERSRLKPNLY